MAHQPFPQAHIGDRYQALSPFQSSTAYTGAIDLSNLDDQTLNDDSYSASPPKTPKSTLSTRLLSSLPAAQPAATAAFTRSKSILHSRAKSLASWTSSLSAPTATGSNKLFGDFFAPGDSVVRLGVSAATPTIDEEDDLMEYRPALTQRSSYASRKSIVAAPAAKQGWFGRKSSGGAPPASNDELANLNINNALFPNGPADPLSPSDFNDLLLNATRLLERMQTAYKEKVEYIASIQPEMDAQKEEVEESETRAQHLKMQLEDMSRKSQEHEKAMSALRTQLEQERSRTIRIVDDSDRRRKRGSAGSASDSGFESDWDRESVASSSINTPRTPPPTNGSPFDNLDQRLHDRNLQRQATIRAGNVRADDSTVAWNTVQQLRTENQDLRRQVDVMNQTLQGCIDFVDTAHI